MSEYRRINENSEALLFRGDPRTGQGLKGIDEWFTAILEHKSPQIAKRPYLYGSDAGFCPRRNTLLEHNTWIDSLVNSAGSAYMSIGVAFENLLAESLVFNQRLIVQNQRLITLTEVFVSGKMDLLVWDRDEELAIIEVKTTGDLPLEPKPGHLAQVLTYSALSGIPKAYLLYMSRKLNPKSPIPIKVFAIDTSEEVLLRTLTTIFLSRLATDEHLLLPIPSTFRKHTECHYCEFRDYYCYRPREGLKDDSSPSIPNSIRVEDITPTQFIELESKCKAMARELYKSRYARYQKSIQSLIGDPRVSEDNANRLRELSSLV